MMMKIERKRRGETSNFKGGRRLPAIHICCLKKGVCECLLLCRKGERGSFGITPWGNKKGPSEGKKKSRLPSLLPGGWSRGRKQGKKKRRTRRSSSGKGQNQKGEGGKSIPTPPNRSLVGKKRPAPVQRPKKKEPRTGESRREKSIPTTRDSRPLADRKKGGLREKREGSAH